MSAVSERLAELRGRIDRACDRVGRDPDDVGIVAVTKRFPAETVRAAVAAGLRDIGENYVQEMVAKMDEVADPSLRWHFIGHLQRNKVKHIVGRVHLIHAVGSTSLVDELARRCEGAPVRVLIAVNVGGEAQKSGIAPDAAGDLVAHVDAVSGVVCEGLMTMPPLPEDPEDSRPHFRALRELRDLLATPERPLSTLSMGTSGDLEVAVEEGASLIRVGTALFGPRSQSC